MNFSLRECLVLVCVCAALYILPAAFTPVHTVQEARILVSAREMVRKGSWLVPVFNGQARLQKPPLVNWAVAGLFKLFSTDSAALARLLSLLAACGAVLCVYITGNLMKDAGAGFMPALFYACSPEFWRAATAATTEPFLHFFSLLAMMLFFLFMKTGRRLHAALVYASCGFAFMCKGPAGLLPLVFAVCAAAAVEPARLRKMISLPGIAAMGMIILPWYVAVWFNQESAAAIISKELSVTFLSGEDHRGPFYYYIPRFFLYTFPWGLLLPWAITDLLKHRQKAGTMAAAWFFAGFFILSFFVINKQRQYSLIFIAPAALLAGFFALERLGSVLSCKKFFNLKTVVPALVLLNVIYAAGLMLNKDDSGYKKLGEYISSSNIEHVYFYKVFSGPVVYYAGRNIPVFFQDCRLLPKEKSAVITILPYEKDILAAAPQKIGKFNHGGKKLLFAEGVCLVP